MSRRKQSNPKSLKDVSERMLQPDTQDDDEPPEKRRRSGNSESETTNNKGHSAPRSPLDSPALSPDNIDVVSNSPRLSPDLPASEDGYSASAGHRRGSSCSPPEETVIFKLEREDRESSSQEEASGEGSDLHYTQKKAPSSPKTENPTTQGLIRHLQLPSDVLYLKEMEVIVHGNRTPSWMICSAIPLPKGSSLGPFAGDMVSAENVRVGDLIVEFHSKTGHVALVNVAGHSGAWLALLRPATNGVTRNTLVYLEGGRIWCEIVSDVDIGMELRATFVFDLEDMPLADRELSVLPLPSATTNNSDTQAPGSSSPSLPSQPVSASTSAVAVQQQTSPPGHAALIYACPFCGVRFSSPRTLQGHLSYYCSKKKAEHIISPRPTLRHNSDSQGSQSAQETVQVKQEVNSDSSPPVSSPQLLTVRTSLKRTATSSDSSASDCSTSPTPAKIPVLKPLTYQCTVCNFRAEKHILNRHMKIHNTRFDNEAGVRSTMTAGSEPVPNGATYCKECNIQFSSISTYKGHKEHYCSQRQTGRTTSEVKDICSFELHRPVSVTAMPSELSAASLQFASLGQSGLLFPPGQALVGDSGSLAARAMIPGGQVILTAPVLTPTGLTSMSIPLPTGFLQSIHNAAAAAAAAVQPSSSAASVISPRAAISPQKSLSSSPPKGLEILPRSSSAAPEEAHQSKSPRKSPRDSDELCTKELPLDLSKKRSEPNADSTLVDLSFKKEPEEERPENAKREIDDERFSSTTPLVWSSVGGRPIRVDSADHELGRIAAPVTPTSLAIPPPSVLNASLLPGFLPVHAMAAAAAAAAGILSVPPPSFPTVITPGVSSKCSDCGIPFYKRENLLIHKKHYCSGKRARSPAATGSTGISESSHCEEKNPGQDVKQEAAVTATSSPPPESGCSQSPPRKDSKEPLVVGSSKQPVAMPTPRPSPGTKLPGRSSVLTPPLAAGLEDVRYKFFCIPCNIKYSSASNLKAHKEFYCPHGKNSEHTIIMQMPSGEIVSPASDVDQSAGSNTSSPSPGNFSCSRCQSSFTSSRLLKLHLCTADSAQSSLLRCAHCEYVTHTDKRLAEHMKVHNPTSAFRCTLCGYRGNTIRGMRMHGKTHTENGEDFTDSHMIEFQEPPLVPIQTNNELRGLSQGPVDVEAELLRLKNEPYKRRRSRKAYEKVDIMVPLDEPPICHLCGECFEDRRSLVMHLRIHELASQYMPVQSRCALCDYAPKTYDDLMAHMEVAHNLLPREEKENRLLSASPDRPQSSDRRNLDRTSLCENHNAISVRVKEEPGEESLEQRKSPYVEVCEDRLKQEPVSPTASLREDSNSSGNELDDRGRESNEFQRQKSPAYPQTFSEDTSEEVDVGKHSESSTRVKSEPESERDDEDDDSFNDPPLPITFAADFSVRSASLRRSVSPREALSSRSQSGDESRTEPASLQTGFKQVDIKTEPAPQHPDDKPSEQECNLLVQSRSRCRDGSYPPVFVSSPSAASVIVPDVPVKSYCKICDITFQQEATLIAHKKYYCPERTAVVQSASA